MGYLVFIETNLEASSVSPFCFYGWGWGHFTSILGLVAELGLIVAFIPLKENPVPGQHLTFTEIILSTILNGTKITANY